MKLKNDLIEVYGKYSVYYNKAHKASFVVVPASWLKRVGNPKRVYIYRVGDSLKLRPDNVLTRLIAKLAEYDLPDEVIELVNEL